MTYRLDYHNSLLYGINWYSMSQLKRCRNNVPCIMSLPQKYNHITPVLEELNWLPFEQIINFKILLLACTAQYGMAPLHLSSLLSPYTPGKPQRSDGKHLLTSRQRLEVFVKCCSAHAAPSLWNILPISTNYSQSIDTFKSSPKTHLFNGAYPQCDLPFYHIVCILRHLVSYVRLSDTIRPF